MPLYEYRCLKCNRHTDKIEKLNGPFLKKCPHCGGKVESVITAPAIQFKGSGWDVTDYGGKSPSGESPKPASEGKSEKEEKAPKSESKPAAPAKESKKASTASKEK